MTRLVTVIAAAIGGAGFGLIVTSTGGWGALAGWVCLGIAAITIAAYYETTAE